MDCKDFKDEELAFEPRPNIFFTLDVFFLLVVVVVEFDTNRLELKLGGASSSAVRSPIFSDELNMGGASLKSISIL